MAENAGALALTDEREMRAMGQDDEAGPAEDEMCRDRMQRSKIKPVARSRWKYEMALPNRDDETR